MGHYALILSGLTLAILSCQSCSSSTDFIQLQIPQEFPGRLEGREVQVKVQYLQPVNFYLFCPAQFENICTAIEKGNLSLAREKSKNIADRQTLFYLNNMAAIEMLEKNFSKARNNLLKASISEGGQDFVNQLRHNLRILHELDRDSAIPRAPFVTGDDQFL
ncbi:MAG: hypothetical protein KDK41_09140 [Leptospiraceae bacterium]|nr:hypothetical protein [Leptospiraceae bacterium]